MSQDNQNILVLNVGSTSVKSRVFTFKKGGPAEIFTWSQSDINPQGGHKKVFSELYRQLEKNNLLEKISAVGHRVVHGGPLKKSLKIGDKEIKIIKKYSDLAPLHNPYNLEGIAEAQKWFKKSVPQIAVFDTAFYAALPERAFNYAIPRDLARNYSLYRYGFHGISHNYSLLEAVRILKKPVNKLKLITIHLGGGSSMTAIDRGVAIDTSMGFTPLEGLVMGTRSGDIDAGIIFYLAEKAKLSLKQIKNIIVHESGIYGICGAKNMLDLLKRVKKKEPKARLAFEMFVYRIQKYIGAYFLILGGCDGIVFTGTVGAGDKKTRESVMARLKKSGLKKVPVLTIKSNEEKMIATEVLKVVSR